MKKSDFVPILLTLSDVLPPLALLSRSMQRGNLNYGLGQPLVTGTIATLVNLKNVPGEYFSSIETYFEDQLADTDIRPLWNAKGDKSINNEVQIYI